MQHQLGLLCGRQYLPEVLVFGALQMHVRRDIADAQLCILVGPVHGFETRRSFTVLAAVTGLPPGVWIDVHHQYQTRADLFGLLHDEEHLLASVEDGFGRSVVEHPQQRNMAARAVDVNLVFGVDDVSVKAKVVFEASV